MTRFLFATPPITGHVAPALSIAGELTARGHELRWYTGGKFRSTVEDAGARFEPFRFAYDFDDADSDAAFPGRRALSGLRRIRWDFEHIFIRQAEPQYRDLRSILERWPAAVMVGDPSMFAPFAINELGGPPNAVYNISCLGISGRGIAPFGLGLLPNASTLGLLRNSILDFVAPNVVFRNVSRALAAQCEEIGVKPRKFTGVLLSPYLFLQPTVERFEYPRSDLPPQVHFIGPLLPESPSDFRQPEWWDEVANKTRPVVLVTQGTVATDARALIAPAIRALAHADVFVLVAGASDATCAELQPLPDNVRVAAFVPFKPLMPMVDVYVTNGGFGGVQYALSNGVPIVAAGTTEDKAEIANRVAFSGTGINLKTNTPPPEAIAAAVRTILTNGDYRRRAKAVQAEMAEHDAPAQAADLLELLSELRKPVLRTQPQPERTQA